jgi:hypothetical protein
MHDPDEIAIEEAPRCDGCGITTRDLRSSIFMPGGCVGWTSSLCSTCYQSALAAKKESSETRKREVLERRQRNKAALRASMASRARCGAVYKKPRLLHRRMVQVAWEGYGTWNHSARPIDDVTHAMVCVACQAEVNLGLPDSARDALVYPKWGRRRNDDFPSVW